MLKLFIVRHGESMANSKEITSENDYVLDCNIELTEAGRKQATKTGIFLREMFREKNTDTSNMQMWVSPFLRTRETAEIINRILGEKKIKEVYEDPRLAEQDFGDFEMQFMQKWKEISPHSYFVNQAKFTDPHGRFFARIENGESMSDVYNRISIFAETRLLPAKKDKIIITHAYASQALEMYLLKKPIEWVYYESAPANASIRLLYSVDGGTTWQDYGYMTIKD